MTRDEAFANLYNLIFRGFLIGGMEMGKSFFVFKTVTEKEFNLVKACAGENNDKGYLSRFNKYFLTHSVFSVDGENVLFSKNSHISEIVSFFSLMPNYPFKYLMTQLEKMRNECFETVKYLEGFCYTSESRRMWKTIGNALPNSEAITGINGTSLMGLNIFQEYWMYLNRVIDNEEAYNKELSFALLIASASNPKGAKQSRSKHDSHVKSTEDHRKKLAEVGYIDVKEWSPDRWSAPVDTAQELVAELDRQMKGMKDRHDQFIEKHIQNIRDEADRRTK